jgi:putative hydrolase of the HAD superfamily
MKHHKLIFDFGNVFIGVNESLTYDAFASLNTNPNLANQEDLFHSLDRGQISQQEFLDQLKLFVPERIMRKDLLWAWNAMLLDIPDSSFRLLKMLKPQFEMALLSNTSVPHIDEIKRKVGPYNWRRFSSSFEHLHYSFDMSCRKPEAEIFSHVEEHHQWAAEACVLIDDKEENLEAAKKAGWQTIHFALDQGGDHLELAADLQAFS